MEYKCDNYYVPQSEGAIAWNDAELAFDWQIPTDKVLLSTKDREHPSLAECKILFE